MLREQPKKWQKDKKMAKKKKKDPGVPAVSQWVKNLTSIHEDEGSVTALVQWVKDLVLPASCSRGHTCGLDLVLLWLWCRPQLQFPFDP